jgi:hypothetical protein
VVRMNGDTTRGRTRFTTDVPLDNVEKGMIRANLRDRIELLRNHVNGWIDLPGRTQQESSVELSVLVGIDQKMAR